MMNLLYHIDFTKFRVHLEGEETAAGTAVARSRFRLTTQDGPSSPILESWFRTGTPLEEMLRLAFKKHYPNHPLYLEWLERAGYAQVRFIENLKDYEIGEIVHTALRKCADSKESVITWNAIHHMATDDVAALWAAIRAYLDRFASAPSMERRELAEGLKKVVIECLEDRAALSLRSAGERRIERLPAEAFALRMLTVGCEMTSIEEWMYGWLGFIVEEIEEDEESEAD
jgi:hypothetical protein